ncbi:SDR family oxidoreductase [Streptomyces somaliensis]|uniref:SDR family oxidoreductase n=1 Tax=Streptomyces somaliensis (strain ATCC 33201 / DSM 40738 / JCM 12659 / KCTC 9044 / NCTC 11332 / NRRL B-12077 / IP 733) TaxID=1134445 RepID=A0AA44IFH2_STRE0|nr:SDR family oxidoreductase [Streptomyces somaliensis]NKY16388.1 SDR family oxidoreductase [Streptomyces somaliensis DSM 40738]
MAARTSPLHGRTAVVTGAARGLGEALAVLLAERGARVALVGHEEEALARVRDRLPTRSECWEADVTGDTRMARVAAEVAEVLGPPSVVVANAGVAEGGPLAESDPAVRRRVVEVNLVGSAVTARSHLPGLLATRGYFLQVASLASIGAVPMMSAYCASKAGAEAFAHSLRAEVAHRGVGVGIAYPNWTDTDMIRDADTHPVLRELRGHMPPPARGAHCASHVAERLVRAVERRRPAVYVPSWLRAVQPVRAALPAVVADSSRRRLPRLDAGRRFEATGLLGAGGRTDAPPPPGR